MKRCLNLLMSTVLVGGMFFGCEPADDFIPEDEVNFDAAVTEGDALYEGLPSYFVKELQGYQSILINENSYRVELTARVVGGTVENPTTTFHYRVTGQGVNPALDSFYLEVPECASLINYTPEQSALVQDGFIKWNSSVTKDETREYSMTFEGDVPLGIISTNVTRGSNEEKKSLLGPCQGVYTLSGQVFIDSAIEDGQKQASESGILSEVTLVYKSIDPEKEVVIETLPNGQYDIFVLEGDYQIRVNKDLLGDGYYTIVDENRSFISFANVTENSSGNNFPFRGEASMMINDFESGELKVNTEPTKYWINQVRNAGKKNSEFNTIQDLNEFLIKVEDRNLFDFGANKQESALDILTRPIKTDLDLYLQQLLTAEFNVLSGRGAYTIKDGQLELLLKFNEALLIYAEAIACQEICNDSQLQKYSTRDVTIKAVSSTDSKVLLSFNGSGGLGGR